MAKDCTKHPVARMDKRVTIQFETQVSDGQGGQTTSWADAATVWASIEPVKAWERMQAMQMQTPVTHKVTMRYRSGVTTAMRLLFGDRILWIKEVINPNEANQFLQIKALERSQG